MATRVAQAYGAWAGPSPSLFRVVAEIWDYGDTGSGRKLTLYRYVQVNSGSGFGGTSLTNSWGGNIAIYGAGNYGQNETSVYQKGYGETLSFPASTTTAYYYGSRKYESSVAISYTVPKPKYTVSYNANGGSDAPASQTKIWGTNLTLSTKEPVKNGYIFQGWSTSSTGGVVYGKGASYTANASVTLYAVWKIITYSITYNANGGTNAPPTQQKNWGENINITTTKPTRVNYNFIGWGTSPDDSVPTYKSGELYTTNASITLYAIWELAYIAPRINNLQVYRSNSDSVYNDEGLYITITCDWATDKPANYIEVMMTPDAPSAQMNGDKTLLNGQLSGTYKKTLMSSGIDVGYSIDITIVDSYGQTVRKTEIQSFAFTIDVLRDGSGVAFGQAAIQSGLEVNMDSHFKKSIKDMYNTNISNGVTPQNTNSDANSTLEHEIVTNVNTPNNQLMYVVTRFYNTKSVNANRMQVAYPYNNTSNETYYRYYNAGTWTVWKKYLSEENVNDYIVEQGSNDNWIWKKWNNGLAECWGTFGIVPPSLTSGDPRGGVYYCIYNPEIDTTYPVSFKKEPFLTATITSTLTYACLCYIQPTLTKIGTIVMSRGNNNFYRTIITVHVTGRWK